MSEPIQPSDMSSNSTLLGKVFWLGAIVILVSIFAVVYVLLRVDNPTFFQYRITVALVCFVLSSIAGLLFAANNVNIQGTIGIFTVVLAGPAFMWLAALLIFTYLYPEEKYYITRLLTLKNISSLIKDKDHRDGFLDYSEWIDAIGPGSRDLINNTDDYQIRDLFAIAFDISKKRKYC